MSLVAFVDDNIVLGQAFLEGKYKMISDAIKVNCNELTYYIPSDGEIYGYKISDNLPLTKIYGFPCKVVKFFFSSVSTVHANSQLQIMNKLCSRLIQFTKENHAYYNFRVPIHIVDLQMALNNYLNGAMLCGGTVEWISKYSSCDLQTNDNISLFFADNNYLSANKSILIKMANDSFENYQGQYHISPIMNSKAGEIYKQWIENSIDEFVPNSVIVAEYRNHPVGFVTLRHSNFAVDGVLSCVDPNSRGQGTYKSLIAYAINYAKSLGKQFVTSTQLDNYIVQGVWSNFGCIPFYSIYNIHLDCRF